MQRIWVLGILVCLASVLAACSTPTLQVTQTVDPQLVLTAAAQTANARLTATASALPTITLQPTADLTQTAAVQTQQVVATETALATLMVPESTPTQVLVPVSISDRAEFVKDVTVQDGDDFKPGASFTKTWRIKNAGVTTWTTEYVVVYIDGERMGAPELIHLSGEVKPGKMVDISVNLIAPQEEGRYRGWFTMVNPQGIFIDDAFYVEIEVVIKKK